MSEVNLQLISVNAKFNNPQDISLGGFFIDLI